MPLDTEIEGLTEEFTYDVQQRLTSSRRTWTKQLLAGQPAELTTHYGYDAMGRRMSRQSREWLAPARQAVGQDQLALYCR